ncbi:MAG TPA: TRAP transporter substrate-binding protein DctP [Burkholderiaceae bacterium]|nr:TRAP transporter substrate-binding protein DctP [Burkholderiaceae bacterium]
MTRRSFLAKSAVGAAAATTLAAPAIVRAQPAVRWRMASSFPKAVPAIWGASELLVQRVGEMTGGRFQISLHAGGELVPPFQVLDAVQNGTVECGHTALYYFFGKDPTWSFGTIVPFGLNARQFAAWWYYLGGEKVFNEFANQHGITAIYGGNTGAQMGGWFRREINTVDDLKGLKFRIAGLAGTVLSRLGVVPQQIPGGEVYAALERGTIDATEWVGPFDDERLGFHKVAKFYYYPGWWEGSAAVHAIVNNKAFEALPAEYRTAFRAATAESLQHFLARYDAENPQAIRRLVAGGAQLRAFSRPILDASYKATQEVYAEIAGQNPAFKKVHDSFFAHQRDMIVWWRVGESSFDDYMAQTLRR